MIATLFLAAGAALSSPEAEAAIAEACGMPVKILVREDSFTNFPDDRPALEAAGYGFLVEPLVALCAEPEMRAAVQAQIRTVTLTNAQGAPDPMVYFGDVPGRLFVDYQWVKGEPAPAVEVMQAEIAARLRGEEMEAP